MEYILEQINQLLQGNPLLAVPFAFVGGVLTSFTPCVYPMIPIVVGVIGARASQSKRHAFFLSLSYAFGLSIVYAFLGLVSAATGTLFGSLSTNVWVNLAIANVFIFFGLSMFGVFNLQLPHMFKPKTEGKPKGFFTALLVGVGSGFVAAPCTAPVLGSLMVYIGTTKNLVLGMVLMFSFSLGMSTLLIIIGTSAGIVTALPKSGKWMNAIKYFLAILMIGVGEFFLYRAGQFGAW